MLPPPGGGTVMPVVALCASCHEFGPQVKSDHVATGLLNGTVGNKGGVCVGCMLGARPRRRDV